MSVCLIPAVPLTVLTASNCLMTTSVSASPGSQVGDVRTGSVCVNLIHVKMEGPVLYQATLH